MVKKKDSTFWYINHLFLLIGSLLFFYKFDQKLDTYSIVNFNSKNTQTIFSGSTLVGKGVPKTKAIVFLTPGKLKKELQISDEGSWTYQIDNNLKPGNYRLTVKLFDGLEKLIYIKSYPITIKSKNIFENFNQLFSVKKAGAQESLTDDEEKWVVQMRKLGIWPVKEDGEFILYSEEEYDKRYCPGTCPKLTRPRPIGEQIQGALGVKQFNIIQELIKKLQLKGYAPLPVLIPYIPELENEDYQKKFGITKAFAVNAKREISEQDLKEILNEVISQQVDYYLRGGDVRTLIDLAGIGTVVDVFSGEKKFEYLSSTEARDFAFGLMILYGPAKSGIQVGTKAIRFTSEALAEIRLIRSSLQAGEAIPVRAIAANELVNADVMITHVKDTRLLPKTFPSLLSKYATKDLYLVNKLKKILLADSRAYVMDPKVSRVFADHLMTELEAMDEGYLARVGINIPRQAVYETIDNNWIVVVPRVRLIELCGPGAGGCASGKVIILGDTSYNILYHEMVHLIAHQIESGLKRFPTFRYNQEQAETYGRLMSVFYELSTDLTLERLFGFSTRYKGVYPQFYDSIQQLIWYINRRYDTGLTTIDFVQFALTRDDRILMNKILAKMTPEQFMEVVGVRIDLPRFNQIMADRIARQQAWLQEQVRFGFLSEVPSELKNPGIISRGFVTTDNGARAVFATGGSVMIALSAHIYTTIASHQNPPSADPSQEIVVIDLPPDFEADVNLLKQLPQIPNQVKIIEIEGRSFPGGSIKVKAMVSDEGNYIFEDPYFHRKWVIRPAKQNRQGLLPISYAEEVDTSEDITLSENGCQEDCDLNLPQNIEPGEYLLTTYIVDNATQKILASDTSPITIKKPLKKVIKITFFNGEDIPIVDGQAIFKTHLPGQVGQAQNFNIPIVITLNDGTRYLDYNLNYQPTSQPTSGPVNQETPSQQGEIEQPSSNPTTNQGSCSSGYRDGSSRQCIGSYGCKYNVNVCNSDGQGWHQEEEQNCDFAPSNCNQINPPASNEPQSQPTQNTPQETACWINADPNNRTASNEICGQNHQGATRCDQYDTGPWGDGCVI